jgi:hypothetical protein
MRQDFCRYRFFLFERGGARHTVDADRDEGVPLQDVHHLEAGFVVVEIGEQGGNQETFHKPE